MLSKRSTKSTTFRTTISFSFVLREIQRREKPGERCARQETASSLTEELKSLNTRVNLGARLCSYTRRRKSSLGKEILTPTTSNTPSSSTTARTASKSCTRTEPPA